jgi:hypothetical protein
MESKDKKPLAPDQLGTLYPTPKTYDEKIAERAAMRTLKQSRRAKHPRLVILLTVLSLLAAIAAITFVTSRLIWMNALFGVPMAILLFVVWFYALVISIRKIRHMIDTNENF